MLLTVSFTVHYLSCYAVHRAVVTAQSAGGAYRIVDLCKITVDLYRRRRANLGTFSAAYAAGGAYLSLLSADKLA